MPDQVAFPAMALLAAGIIALALVWPQGQGAASPPPFRQPLERLDAPAAPAPTMAEKLRGAVATPKHRK